MDDQLLAELEEKVAELKREKPSTVSRTKCKNKNCESELERINQKLRFFVRKFLEKELECEKAKTN